MMMIMMMNIITMMKTGATDSRVNLNFSLEKSNVFAYIVSQPKPQVIDLYFMSRVKSKTSK